MKVKDVDALREELYKNMCKIYFDECNIYSLEATEFREENLKEENKKYYGVRELVNPLCIRKFYHDDNWKEIVDDELYMTIEWDCVDFFSVNVEKQCFHYEESIYFHDCPNKTVFFMRVACKFAQFAA